MDVILAPVLELLIFVIQLYIYVVIAAVVLSWMTVFNVINTRNRFVYLVGDAIYRLTEPALQRLRAILPNLGGLDLSPVALILLLMLVQGILHSLAVRLVS